MEDMSRDTAWALREPPDWLIALPNRCFSSPRKYRAAWLRAKLDALPNEVRGPRASDAADLAAAPDGAAVSVFRADFEYAAAAAARLPFLFASTERRGAGLLCDCSVARLLCVFRDSLSIRDCLG